MTVKNFFHAVIMRSTFDSGGTVTSANDFDRDNISGDPTTLLSDVNSTLYTLSLEFQM